MTRGQFRSPSPARVVWDGQSMNVVPAAPDNIPTLAMFRLPGVPWVNVAAAGRGWYDLTNGVTGVGPASTRRDPHARNRAGCADILVMNGGQGDAVNGSAPSGQQNAATCYQRALDYASAARTAGFTHVVGVAYPAIGPDAVFAGRPTESEQAALEGHNALMLADPGSWDAIVDLSTAPFDDATDTTYFNADRTHLSEAGALTAALRFVTVLEDLIGAL